MIRLLPLAALTLTVSASAQERTAPPGAAATTATSVERLGVEVIRRYPHDPRAFTEGLIWRDGALFESVGKEGVSEVRRVALESGRVLARARIPAAQFGEGLASWRDTLVSLTWHDGIAHRWNARTLKPEGQSRYPGEGWGLTGDGAQLIRSDGSATLRFVDPVTFAERRRVTVTLNGRAIDQINELEMVDGALLANVWHSPYIVRIDPANGRITGIADCSAIVAEIRTSDPDAVLNGIAWDARGKRLFITGKLWPTLYEVRFTTGAR